MTTPQNSSGRPLSATGASGLTYMWLTPKDLRELDLRSNTHKRGRTGVLSDAVESYLRAHPERGKLPRPPPLPPRPTITEIKVRIDQAPLQELIQRGGSQRREHLYAALQRALKEAISCTAP